MNNNNHPTPPLSAIAEQWIADGNVIRPKRNLYGGELTSLQSYANYCMQRGDPKYSSNLTGQFHVSELKEPVWQYFIYGTVNNYWSLDKPDNPQHIHGTRQFVTTKQEKYENDKI